ncbi:hypothetical protein FB639_004691, partial [Coemansia asiatica]
MRVVGGLENFRFDDLPVGKSACLAADSIDRKDSFVLHHIWDNRLSFKIRMPRGRVFPVDSKPLFDIEAVPISKEYRFTRLTLALEEITIVARPTIAGIARQGSVLSLDSAQSTGKAKANQQQQQQQQRQQSHSLSTRRSSLTGSVMSQASTSSEDAHASIKASHNAWAYAKECSSEYQNAITKVRELSRLHHELATQQHQQHNLHQGTVAAFHGILASKVHLSVPHHLESNNNSSRSCADIRNSHIQVHHQLVYELDYQRLDVAELNEANAAFSAASADARIKAVAHVYKALSGANIVRRDELRDAAANAGSGRSGVVRGTLPVAVVSRRISDLWGIRNLSQDTLSNPSAVVAALMDVEQPAFCSSAAAAAAANVSGPASLSFPAPPSITVTADSSSSLHARRSSSVASFGTCASSTAAASNNGHQQGQSAADENANVDVSAALVRNSSTSTSTSSQQQQQQQDLETVTYSSPQNAASAYPPASAAANNLHYGGRQMQMPVAPMAMPQSTYPTHPFPHAPSPPAPGGFNMMGMNTSSLQYPPYYPQFPGMAVPVPSAHPTSPSATSFQPYPPAHSTASTGTDSGVAAPIHAIPPVSP